MSEEKEKQKHMFMQSGNTFVPEEPLLFTEREALTNKMKSLETECEVHANAVLSNIQQIKELQGMVIQAERRGEERGFNAARRCYRPTNIDAFGPLTYTHETISDWRNSEEYKKGGG